jgi:hypothetical protein
MNSILFIFRKWYVFVATILLLNLSFIFIYKDRVASLFIAAAMLIFIGALILAKVVESERDSLPWRGLNSRSDEARRLLLFLPFLIPIIFCSFHGRIVFWNFNEVARAALAWFIFSLLWLNSQKTKTGAIGFEGVLAPFLLGTAWVMVLWLSLIWDVGAGVIFSKAISSEAIVSSDRLASVIYKIWEAKPFSEHYGLAFTDYATFKEAAYAGHSQLYLLINYGAVKSIQLLMGCKMEVATRLLPFFLSIIMTVSVTFFFLKTKINLRVRKISTQLTLFLGLGFLLSLPDFWITLLRYNTDNAFPWVSYMTLILFAYVCQSDYGSRGFVLALFFYALLSPLCAIISILTFCFFVANPKVLNERHVSLVKILTVLSVGLALATMALIYPHVIGKLLKYRDVGSSFLFRAGLDGDTSYYNNIWQAVIRPYAKSSVRPWSGLLPAAVFCVIAFFLGGRRKQNKPPLDLMNSIFLFSPYLFSVVFFPQAVSIHPYLYDYLLVFPLAFLGIYGLFSPELQEKIEGPWLLLFFLYMTSFVVFNLTKIAQAARNLSF